MNVAVFECAFSTGQRATTRTASPQPNRPEESDCRSRITGAFHERVSQIRCAGMTLAQETSAPDPAPAQGNRPNPPFTLADAAANR